MEKMITLAEEMLDKVTGEANRVAVHIPATEWYVFGSCLTEENIPSDVDVMVIYERQQDSISIREHLASFLLSLPVHIILLNKEEEAELNFIHAQRCTKIYPVSLNELGRQI